MFQMMELHPVAQNDLLAFMHLDYFVHVRTGTLSGFYVDNPLKFDLLQ